MSRTRGGLVGALPDRVRSRPCDGPVACRWRAVWGRGAGPEREAHNRVGARGLGRRIVLEQRDRTPTEKGLHSGGSAQPAAWTDHRRAGSRELSGVDIRSNRAGRPLLRRVRHHERRHGQRGCACLHRRLHTRRRRDRRRSRSEQWLLHRPRECPPRECFQSGAFRRRIGLYLRWEANGPYSGFVECFANGVNKKDAAVLAATQRPASAAQFEDPSGPPAWKDIPTWSLIGTLDNVIPPALQEFMSSRADATISRVRAGHLTPITRPGDVVKVILSAVDATT